MRSIPFKNISIELLVLLTPFVLMLLAISKDLIHSFIKDYHFYLFESMLFGLFWPLFVPLVFLSKKLLKKRHPIYKVLFPFLFSALHIFLFSLLVFSISGLFYYHTFGFTSVFIDTIGDSSLSCLLIYSTVNFIALKDNTTGENVRQTADKIRINHGNKVIILNCKDLMYIQTERPYVALVTESKTYLHNCTLKGFKEDYLNDQFIQIHKSTIINTAFITSFKPRKNGDYDLIMANGDQLKVSRNFNAYFTS